VNTLTWLLGLTLGGLFVVSGAAKVIETESMVRGRRHLGLPPQRHRAVGGAEMLGAFGVLIATIFDRLQLLGVASALGFVALMLGALRYHDRAGDPFDDMIPALTMGLLNVAFAIALVSR